MSYKTWYWSPTPVGAETNWQQMRYRGSLRPRQAILTYKNLPSYASANHYEETNEHDRKEKKLPTMQQIIAAQHVDAYCHRLAEKADAHWQCIYIRQIRHLVMASTTGRSDTKTCYGVHNKTVLKREHDLTIPNHPVAKRTYDTMRRSQPWLQMANDVYTYLKKCPACQQLWQHRTHQCLL